MTPIQTGGWPRAELLRLSINLLPPPGGRVPGVSSGYAFSKELVAGPHIVAPSALPCSLPLLVASCVAAVDSNFSFSLLPWGPLLGSGYASTEYVVCTHHHLYKLESTQLDTAHTRGLVYRVYRGLHDAPPYTGYTAGYTGGIQCHSLEHVIE